MTTSHVRTTTSICPVCLRQLEASIVSSGDNYYLEKTCPEHGEFSAVIWRGNAPSFEDWCSGAPENTPAPPDCPTACGLCAHHKRKTCCALVEVTSRCNLTCPVCFASSGETAIFEPSVATLYAQFQALVKNGNTFVQLSGGEPTVRDDLPEIVAAAKRAGCENIQLNSNGLRLGSDPAFTKALADAGLSFVFMQFDGTTDDIYEKLRGQPLLAQKKAAIKVCAENLLGVTLVPTLVPGVNDQDIGNIVRFGLKRSPAVRGIHFQPVSYFGRYPSPPSDDDRMTLPEVLRAIETQTDGKIKLSHFAPSCCDHPRCGFHGDFVVLPNGMLMRLTAKSNKTSCCGDDSAHLKNRNFVSRRWKRTGPAPEERPDDDFSDFDTFLGRVRSHGFTITAMAFQDAYTLDLERLQSCSLHVFKDGRTIPFCANYMTACIES